MLELESKECCPEGDGILEKLISKSATVGVIGLGYVGLPLAVEKAKAGFRVIGFDIQQSKVDMVNAGHNYIGDIVDEELKILVESGMLNATTDYSEIQKVDTVTICVPTPLDKYQQPDMSFVISSAKQVAKHLHKGMLVVLESTSYPGTTEEVIKPILEGTGMKCGRDFFLAYSPERVDPGNLKYKIKNTPKVVGGISARCTEIAAKLYEVILQGEVYKVSSPSAAEMEKILENTFRYVNIALINQVAMLCNKMGINVLEVIEAAKTKPYGFMAFYPGPGPGGHCIPIDPFYLTWKAKSYNYSISLIDAASGVNRAMPGYIVERLIKILNEQGKPLKESRVLLLGVAYKKDIDDYRESPVLEIIQILKEYNTNLFFNDPYIPAVWVDGVEYRSSNLSRELLNSMDVTVITTDHSVYNYDFILENSKAIFDTRCVLKDGDLNTTRVFRL